MDIAERIEKLRKLMVKYDVIEDAFDDFDQLFKDSLYDAYKMGFDKGKTFDQWKKEKYNLSDEVCNEFKALFNVVETKKNETKKESGKCGFPIKKGGVDAFCSRTTKDGGRCFNHKNKEINEIKNIEKNEKNVEKETKISRKCGFPIKKGGVESLCSRTTKDGGRCFNHKEKIVENIPKNEKILEDIPKNEEINNDEIESVITEDNSDEMEAKNKEIEHDDIEVRKREFVKKEDDDDDDVDWSNGLN